MYFSWRSNRGRSYRCNICLWSSITKYPRRRPLYKCSRREWTRGKLMCRYPLYVPNIFFLLWKLFVFKCKVFWNIWIVCSSNAGWPVGFYRISTTKKKLRISTKYRPHSTLSTKYRPQKFLKKRVFTLVYLLSSPEINIFWENEAFCEIWGINEEHFNWVHLH